MDIYCSQTAKDALSTEDLEWLIDLIIHRLEPQAVNPLLSKFPSFGEAAERGEISTQIGLYIYFRTGDADGKFEHEVVPEAVAYVHSVASEAGGSLKYCHMLGNDVSHLVRKDETGEPVRDPSTGKFTLLREGDSITTLQNTLVHELFHVIMADYKYVGDEESLAFTVAYLNNLRRIEEGFPKEDDPNGSILQDFDVNYKSMLDPGQESSSPVLTVAESGDLVESSVSSDKAAIGGGKSAIEPEPVTTADVQEKAVPSGK